MKRILVLLSVLFSVGFSKDIVQLGKEAHDNGDYQKAAQLYEKACDGGIAEGCYNLGVSYINGQGIKQNYQKAAELFNKACDGGIANGCYNLGVSYTNSQGVRQNFSTAKQYYGKACDLGLQLGCDDYRKLNERGIN